MSVDIVAVLTASTAQFKASMAEAGVTMDTLSKEGSSNFDKLASAGKGALLGIAAVAVTVGAASVDLASKFQTTVSSIAASGGISIKTAQDIGQAFLDTGGSTIYSGNQIATAFAAVAGQVKMVNGGVLTAAASMTVMKAAMDLAEASGNNLSSSTADVTKTLQAFGLGVSSSPLVANVLFNASRDTGTSVDSLTASLDKARATMGDAAPSISDLGGLLLDLTQHGETGRAAMQTLNAAFTGIITPTAAVTAEQVKMGVSFINTRTGALLPLSQIIGELSPKIAGMGNAMATQTLKALGFGSASAKLVTTIQAGPAAFDADTAAVSKAGSAHDAAAKQSQTLAHQLDAAKATAEDLATKLGQVLIPILEKLMNGTEKVVTWFEKHKTAAEVLAGVIAGVLATAIGAYVLSLITVETAEGLALAPIIPIIAAVALLAAGAVLLATHWTQVWDQIKHAAEVAWNFIYNGFGKYLLVFLGPVGLLALGVIELSKHWKSIWDDIQKAVQDVWKVLKPIFDTITSAVKDITKGISDVTGAVGKIGGGIIGGIGKAVSWLAEGGPATAHSPYIVGENGPELFIPTASGVVVPNSALAGGTAAGSSAGSVRNIRSTPAAGMGQVVNNYFNGVNFEDENAIASRVGWALRTMPTAS